MKEKINYALVIQTDYPDAAYTLVDGGKGYNYDDYIWENKPSKEILDARYQEIKRTQDVWIQFIDKRNKLLTDSDKYATIDYPHSDDTKKQAWLQYRQQLRDLPNNTTPYYNNDGNMDADWPIPPV